MYVKSIYIRMECNVFDGRTECMFVYICMCAYVWVALCCHCHVVAYQLENRFPLRVFGGAADHRAPRPPPLRRLAAALSLVDARCVRCLSRPVAPPLLSPLPPLIPPLRRRLTRRPALSLAHRLVGPSSHLTARLSDQ